MGILPQGRNGSRIILNSLTWMDFAAGHALAVNSVLGQLLCKEKNSCTLGVQERGGYPLGKMPTLT